MSEKQNKKTVLLPKVSVVIATYNRGVLLKRLLANLSSQTLSCDKFEVVVVDDESRIPAEQLLVGEIFPFEFRLIRQKNAGAAGARDTGIKNSRGDIIVIVDDDMEVKSDFLEQHLAVHEQGADVVLGRVIASESMKGMPLQTRYQQYRFDRVSKRWEETQHDLKGENLYTGNVSFRKALYEQVGGFDLSLTLSEDRELGARFTAADAKFVFAKKAVTINNSDHVNLDNWLETARRYGGLDWVFAQQHEAVEHVDPFRFVFGANLVSKPILAAVMAVPVLAPALSRAVMKMSEVVDKKMGMEYAAMKGATLAYCIQYYRGVREEAGSLKVLWKGWQDYLKKRERK